MKELDNNNIPEHVAIIMDGNGRWAKKRFLPRNAGHVAGAKTVEKIMYYDEIDCRDLFDGNDSRERIMIFEIM